MGLGFLGFWGLGLISSKPVSPKPLSKLARRMPDIEQLMQVWPAEFEARSGGIRVLWVQGLGLLGFGVPGPEVRRAPPRPRFAVVHVWKM